MFGFNKPQEHLRTEQQKVIPDNHDFSFTKRFSLRKERSIFKIKIQGQTELEQALYLFRDMLYNDKIKFLIYRMITSRDNPSNIIIIGPKGTNKTAILEAIAAACHDVIYINSKTTIAGLVQTIQENPNVRIILIDEIDKILDRGERDAIRGFLSTGKLSRILKSGNIEIEIKNLITICTANSNEKLDGPFLDRFTRFYLPEYTEDQFREICAFRMPEYPKELIYNIAQFFIDQKMKDVRNIVKLRSMIRPTDSLETIEMIVSSVAELENTSTKNVNWNKR